VIRTTSTNRFQKTVLKLFCVLLSAYPCAGHAEVLVPAGDPNINYYGRFDFSSPAQPKFNWSGSAIETAFLGPSIGINLHDGQSDYDLEIDGTFCGVISTTSDNDRYAIASGLSAQSHTIRVIQRSENHWSAATFGGFYMADGMRLLAPPPKPVKKIEFIGDSYTVGYGNESGSRTCTSQQLRHYTNTNRSFPAIVTKAFHAQSVIVGWSGQGMVRNYGDAAKKSATPYPYYYKSTLGALAGAWNFQQWVPDLAVICLGTNDFSTTPYPDDTMYTNAYHAFIGTVRSNYPNASILCVSTPTGRCDELVRRVVGDEAGVFNRNNVYYAAFPPALAMSGCDWHPSVADDSLIAGVLTASIIKNCGWDTALTAATIPVGRDFQIRKLTISYGKSGQTLYVNNCVTGNNSTVMVIDMRGDLIARGELNSGRTLSLNVSNIPAGVYMVGNKPSGWSTIVVKK
jgi:lysophospholipase L1-like esterase